MIDTSDPLGRLVVAMVLEAALDVRRKKTPKVTKDDKQSAREFLQGDFADEFFTLVCIDRKVVERWLLEMEADSEAIGL